MFYVMLRAAEPDNEDSKVAIYEGQWGDGLDVALQWLGVYGGEEPRQLTVPPDYVHWLDDVIGNELYVAGHWALIGYTS